jgi:hypothetical protein
MLKVELHTHTADDPVDRISHTTLELIDRAVVLGYDALAITLHDHQLDLRHLTPYAADRGLVLIPGVERTIEGRHVLLNFRQGTDAATFSDLARPKSHNPDSSSRRIRSSDVDVPGKIRTHAGLLTPGLPRDDSRPRLRSSSRQLGADAFSRSSTRLDVCLVAGLSATVPLVDAAPDADSVLRHVDAGCRVPVGS